MNKINESISGLYTDISTISNLEKSKLHTKVILLNKLLSEYFGDITLDESRYAKMLPDNKVVLQNLDKKISIISKDDTIALRELSQLGDDKMRLFLKKYNIGFVKDIHLDKSGLFDIEIASLITSHNTFNDKAYSKKIEFNRQLNFLSSIGIKLCESKLSNGSPALLAVQETIDILTNIIEKLGGRGVSFETRNYKNQTTIKTIKFKIQPKMLFSYDEESCFEHVEPITNIINENEKIFLLNEFKQLNNACVDFTNEDLTGVSVCCKNIALHAFSNICKTLNVETEISNAVKEHYELTKKENKLISEKYDILKESVCNLDIKNAVEKVMAKIEKFAVNKIGFNCIDITITNYKFTAELTFNRSGDNFTIYNDDVDVITEEKLEKTFECSNGTFYDETLFILNTQDNISKLNTLLNKSFENSKISTMEIQYCDDIGYYINKLIIEFSDMTSFN